jgi:hypothetical protein
MALVTAAAVAVVGLAGGAAAASSSSSSSSQLHLAYGADPARAMSVAFLSNRSTPMRVHYAPAAAASSSGAAASAYSSTSTSSSFPASSSSGAGAVELNLKSAATNVTRYSVNNNPYGYPAIWNPDW